MNFRDKAAAIRAKAIPRLLVSQGPMTCFHCHQPRHVRRDCSQRQGSQGYGTPQSQSSMGQARTQFVPSHPNTGRRDQYQSQGAAQAPFAIQIGHRGQSIGRGRGQSSRAETFGTQGHVYAVVPQTKLTNQSDVQGTFRLSHFLIRVLF